MESENPTQTQKSNFSNTYKNDQTVDINLTFGDDGGQQTLAELNFHIFSVVSTNIAEQREKFLNEIQSKEQDKNDSLLVFKFQVEIGRERQSFEFIEKGLDQDDTNENTSEMQKLFHRPKTAGRIEMKEGKGVIYVIYRFYHEIVAASQGKQIEQLIQAKVDVDFSLYAVVKGKTEASRRSFTSIKSDFVQVKIQSQKITARDLFTFFEIKGAIDENITQSNFYQLVRNMESAKFDLKFNSLRRILRYYSRIMNEEENDDFGMKQRVAPLSSKGIFKNFTSAHFFMGNTLGFKAELNYKTEEIMMRFVAKIVEMFKGL